MKTLLGLVVACAVVGASARTARADASEACFAAAVEGQKLRNAGKLAASRAELTKCAASPCPEEVTRDCSRWLGEVNTAQPTVVFGARDGEGKDLLDVRVFVDDAAAGSTAAGQPVPLDPGPHKLRFVRTDGSAVDQTFVARAGEKNRPMVAAFSAKAVAEGARAAAPPPDSSSSPSPSRVPAATWALGGVGVAALGVFGYFGARGLGDYEHLGCDAGCSASDKKSVDTKFFVADVALVVSVVALGAATFFYLTRPEPTTARDHFVWRARSIWK